MSPATLTMSPMAEQELRLWPPEPEPEPERKAEQPPTLSAALESLWAQLSEPSTGVCLVCEGDMRPQYSSGAGVVGGRCADCGSTLG